ncbi:uncharacterized protein TRIADDRAFT_57658 [Trichoplax adhaerens]|uniref:PH domain-containing protein n=1 Tax=Trichoplax adhaerens TaxID=10228 RepID=B3S023_TRIAD|nr:hypothetical protein TRIADDRAFT_57658 [Trichoplax adhaerens]EDV23931.1 hypothetical protein TRIADDRAFT_57658 [Trichoplax adhaerens]|eukprot:XP_002113457.1 hypothetical protein TRIADDRAFT_57658 [Trichoplax adhaerens]
MSRKRHSAHGKILINEKLSARAEQLRLDLLRLATDLQQVAQASELSRSSRWNSTRGRWSAAGQKDAQDFVSVQRQIARGEVARQHAHYKTMPCRIRKPRPQLFQSWLKGDQVEEQEDDSVFDQHDSNQDQSAIAANPEENEKLNEERYLEVVESDSEKNGTNSPKPQTNTQESIQFKQVNDVVAINIDDVVRVATFIGQICEYRVDGIKENKLRWCVITKEMDLYLYDTFNQPYVKKMKLPGYKLHLISQYMGSYQHFIIKLNHQDRVPKTISFVMDMSVDLVDDENPPSKFQLLQRQKRNHHATVRKRNVAIASGVKQPRAKSVESSYDDDTYVYDDIFAQLRKLRMSIFHSSLPINQDFENMLTQISEQEQIRVDEEKSKAMRPRSERTSQDPINTTLRTTIENGGTVRSKSANSLRLPKPIDRTMSNTTSVSTTDDYYDRSDNISRYEISSGASSDVYLQPKLKPALIYEDDKYEVPVLSELGATDTSVRKEMPILPKLRKPPSPPSFRPRNRIRRFISDSFSDKFDTRDRNTERFEKLAKKSLVSGYLLRSGGANIQRKRWCILTKDRLYFFVKERDYLPRSIMKLKDCHLDESQLAEKAIITLIFRKSKRIKLTCTNLNEYNTWLSALKSALEEFRATSSDSESNGSKTPKIVNDTSDTSDSDNTDVEDSHATTTSSDNTINVSRSITSVSTKSGIVIVDSDPSSGGSVLSFNYQQPSFFRNAFQGKLDRCIFENNKYVWQNRWCEINRSILYCYVRERDSIACEFQVSLYQCRVEPVNLADKGRPYAFKLISSDNQELATFAHDNREALQSVIRLIRHAAEMSSPVDINEYAKADSDLERNAKTTSAKTKNVKKPKLPMALFQQRPLPPPASNLGRSKSSQDISSEDGFYERNLQTAQGSIDTEVVYHTPTSATSKGFSEEIYEDIDKAKNVILDMYEEASIATSGVSTINKDKNIEDLYEKVDDLRERLRKKSVQVKPITETSSSSNASKSVTPRHQSSDSAKNIPTDSDSDIGATSPLFNSANYASLNKLKNMNRTDSGSSSQKSLEAPFPSRTRSSFSDGEMTVIEGELNLPKQSTMNLTFKKRWCVVKASDSRSRLLIFRRKGDRKPTDEYILSKLQLLVDSKLPNEFKLKYISGENAGSSLHFQAFGREEAAAWAEKLLKHTIIATQSDASIVASFIAENSANSGVNTPTNFSRTRSKRFFTAIFDNKGRSSSFTDVHSEKKMGKAIQKRLTATIERDEKVSMSINQLMQRESQLQAQVEKITSDLKRTKLDLRNAQDTQVKASSTEAKLASKTCEKLFKKMQSLEQSLEKTIQDLNKTQSDIKRLQSRRSFGDMQISQSSPKTKPRK